MLTLSKRFVSLVFSSLLLASCSRGLPYAANTAQPAAQFGRFSASTTVQNADWYNQLPAELKGYYAPAQGKTGLALMQALNQIISSGQRTFSYGEAKSFMYAVADNIQVNGRPGLLDAYSYEFVPGSGGNGNIYLEQGDANRDGKAGDFINCEHTWPQSFFNKAEPMVSDLHHIFPTLSKPNGMRSNYPIGPVTGQVVYSTSGGAKLSARDRTGSHNPNEVTRWFNLDWNQQPHDIMKNDFDVVFEPPTVHKGNSARALLYFYLRYYNKANIRAGAFNEKSFLDNQIPAWVEWSERIDPVDDQERRRHEIIFQKQNNRNPFIDIPNLASLIGVNTLQNN